MCVSVTWLAAEVFPWWRPRGESEEDTAARIRDFAATLGMRVVPMPPWRGHLAVSVETADALLAAAEAEQAGRQPATGQAQPPDPATAAEVTRQGMISPADCLAWKRASLAMGGASAEDFARAAARQGANGL
jgi:hypothetical protein